PTASGNVITLEADTQYIQLNDLNIGTNRLVLQSNTVYSAADGTLIALTYTGTDPMFTATSVSSKIKDIILNFANAPLAAITGSGTELFQIINCRCLGKSGGTYTDLFASSMQNVYWVLTTDGLTYAGNNAVISFFQNVGALAAGSFVDLGVSTFDAFSFANSQGTLASGAVFITGAADSANVNAGGLATVTNTHATGAGTALSGVATDDALWEFSANNGINNSITSLLATHDA
ncbi:MAG: hypothetical protein GY841_00885, partial [FCB group bacterium]|nr:hypothetical protein [FCB group bacterium]